jgi:hypothetical protein
MRQFLIHTLANNKIYKAEVYSMLLLWNFSKRTKRFNNFRVVTEETHDKRRSGYPVS